MDVLVDSNLFFVPELMTLQCVRRHKKVHFLSDILCADGRSVRRDMVSDTLVSSLRTFSLEKPTGRNFELWVYAIRSLTSSHLALERPLGNYLCKPHNTGDWYASADSSTLVRRLPNGFFESYSPSSSKRSSRTPCYFLVDRSSSCPGLEDMDYATVYPAKSGNHVSLHSTAPRPSVLQSSELPSVQDLLAS